MRRADPAYLAADLMSQAEHDVLASAILLTDSEEIARETLAQVEKQLAALSRAEIIRRSLEDYGAVIVCRDMDEAVEFANRLAPEHLEVMCRKPDGVYRDGWTTRARYFSGNIPPSRWGIITPGPNHVLPTSGTARFFSPLSVDSFVKKSSFISYNRAGAGSGAGGHCGHRRWRRGWIAHANSIKIRTE